MARIAVFDSGLGSLSLVGPIMRATRSEVIYLADRQSYPYGAMSVERLAEAVSSCIGALRKEFSPDVIVVGSNTPSLLTPELLGERVIGVLPPIKAAAEASKTGNIAVLASRSASRSEELARHIKMNNTTPPCNVTCIDASALIDIVEHARFIGQRPRCVTAIRKTLHKTFERNSIDVATLSSTHLPLLLPLMRRTISNVTFVDPAATVAERIARLVGVDAGSPTLRVYTTKDPRKLQIHLTKLGINQKATLLEL